jgi:uroporphyrin-III C-methyltransferase/precorrin-2 dehydrogenase/sirohydrochlorin ferrochelatase
MDRPSVEDRSGRMSALARLPVFFALAGRRVFVVGGGNAAAWKAELLSAAGARVDVFAPEPTDDLRTLAANPPSGAITLHERLWQPADCAGAAIAVAECANDAEAAAFATAARAAGVPVNVIDRPAFCDFAFGAIVNRSPLVIGISTDGAAPVFGKAIRTRIEALIPSGFAHWAHAARNWRPRVQAMALSFRSRRSFWERFTNRALTAPDTAPTEAELAALLTPTHTAEAGSIVLVATGPGDPELLTLRAVRALQSADVIVFDDLVSPAILDFARREAKKMLVGTTGEGNSSRQDDAVPTMIALARAGRRVVRLRATNGRAGAEIAACHAAGIAVEVVPGVMAVPTTASDQHVARSANLSDFSRARA